MLDVALDKPAYKAGETARVKIASRMAGRALVAVMSSGLASTQEVDLPAGGGEVPIRVSDDWSPGAYVTVMLYRPMDEKAKRMPSPRARPAGGSPSTRRRACSTSAWSAGEGEVRRAR